MLNFNRFSTQPQDNKFMTCIGDLNRMDSQNKRGGSYFCWSIPAMWTVYNSKILAINTLDQMNATNISCLNDCRPEIKNQFIVNSNNEPYCELCSVAI